MWFRYSACQSCPRPWVNSQHDKTKLNKTKHNRQKHKIRRRYIEKYILNDLVYNDFLDITIKA
jgi:hypothetical protein